jgi:dTDP-4-dehydrorhamnose reductase
MKLLITGGNGQLGRELQELLRSGAADIGAVPDAYRQAEVVAVDVDTLDITDQRLHHEIYLSDARKVAPEKLKTVIRHPIRKV